MNQLVLRLRRQQGAATLVAVMVLFLVMALLAAYANRSLVFEQRIAGSYYRASLAQEVSEGGVDWAVSMLNGPATDDNCQPVATGGTRFVDRYLVVSPADRSTTPAGGTPARWAPGCAHGSSGLTCRCPPPGTRPAQPSTSVEGRLAPSFVLALGSDTTTQYGSFTASSLGCTDGNADNCRQLTEVRSENFVGAARLDASIAFIGAVPSSPASPLTVKGTLQTTGAGGLGLHNSDPGTSGLLVLSAGPAAALQDSRMNTIPGTPPALARRFSDPALLGMSHKQFFQTFMGMAPGRYVNHPALLTVPCPAAGDCGPQLAAAYDAGWRILWVDAPLELSSNIILGTLDNPVVLIAKGGITLTGPMTLNGMVVAQGDLTWTNTGGLTALINGMVTVQGDMQASGRMDIVYQQSVANQLRNRIGSYVRVSGGMRDMSIN